METSASIQDFAWFLSRHPGTVSFGANACTDPTGRSGNYQQICPGRNASIYQLLPCANGLWCCSAGNSGVDCCDAAFTLAVGQVIQPSASVASSNSGQCSATSTTSPSQQTCVTSPISSSSCPKNNTTAIGASLGAVLGATLVGAIVAACLLLRQIQKLKRTEVRTRQPAMEEDKRLTAMSLSGIELSCRSRADDKSF
jgi:hypothetical protein